LDWLAVLFVWIDIMPILFVMFIVVPILEMWLLIRVGGWIGAWPTIGLVALTAIIGINLLRQQGLSTLLRANQKLESGQIPAHEMMEGLLLAIGGALLLTPGFVTDAVGFSCLLPPTRKLLIKIALTKIKISSFDVGAGPASGFQGPANDFRREPPQSSGSIIDGEYQRKD
jgi:UPF0716 protein FxsA